MNLVQFTVKEIMKELDHRSKEFYEFVLPAIDIVEDGNDLVVTIDLPGFTKKDINLRIIGNILSINAKREYEESLGTVYQRHRPTKLDKKIVLPISIKDDEKVVATAKYADGVVTLKVPIPKSSYITIT
jgi:HSP20 family protein